MVEVPSSIGFDEGGVLEALRDPVYYKKTTVTKYRHNKDGKVTSQTVTETMKQITGAQAVALMMGPSFLALFFLTKDLADDAKAALVSAIPVIAPFVWPDIPSLSDIAVPFDIIPEDAPERYQTISGWVKMVAGLEKWI